MKQAQLKPQPGREYWTGDPNRPEIYITMDDCRSMGNDETKEPNYVIDALDILKKKGVKMTIFPAGIYLDRNDKTNRDKSWEVLRRAALEGNEIENHTYLHNDLQNANNVIDLKNNFYNQLYLVRKALDDPNFTEWFARLPYGHGMDNQYVINAAWAEKLAIISWSIDSGGYLGIGKEAVLKNIFGDKHFKNGAVILMHDDQSDIAALPEVIDRILAQGYSIGVLTDILIENQVGSTVNSNRYIAIVVLPSDIDRKEAEPMAA